MSRPADFRDLLFADVALLEGHASARQVAAALLKAWDRRAQDGVSLAEELASVAGLGAEVRQALEAQVDALVEAAQGDARVALTRRGGLSHELHTAVSRQDGDASRHLSSLGAGVRFTLRTLPKDRYLDFMPVGEGGMGIVYWATDTELGRQVAFKVIRPPVAGAGMDVTPPAPMRLRAPDGETQAAEAFQELKARFLQEAWVTGGMEHPGIVPVYELGQTEGGVPYYTMRFVKGRRTLETALDEVRERSFEDRAALLEPFLKVCDALAYAHNRGVVHRDMKPPNVALGEYGEALVLDWGLAKLAHHEDIHASRWQAQVSDFRTTSELSTMTSALGTPGYMAPEAARGDVAEVDRLSDVYSLGAMLFEILTGRRPFAFETFHEYAQQVVGEDAPDARTVDADVPQALATLCAAALSRDRARRPREVTTLAEGIRTWQRRRAEDREIEVLAQEAEAALTPVADASPATATRQAERARLAAERILQLRPGHAGAVALRERAQTRHAEAVGATVAKARTRWRRRAALVVGAVLAVGGPILAYVLEGRRQEAEDARTRARQETERADTHRQRAEEAMAFITEDLRASLAPEGRLGVLAQIGEKARAHFAAIPATELSPEGTRRQLQALHELGEVYLAQGSLPRARAVFEEALAVAARPAHAHEPWARFERDRAEVRVASVDREQGYPRRAAERLAPILERVAAARPPGVPATAWDVHCTRAINERLETRFDLVDATDVQAWMAENLERVRRLAQAPDAPLEHAILRLQTQVLAASVTLAQDGERAQRMAEEARGDALALRTRWPDDVRVRFRILWTDYVSGALCYLRGAHTDAVARLEPLLSRLEQLHQDHPDNVRWHALLARTLWWIGEARSGPLLDYPPQVAWYRRVDAILTSLHEIDPSHAGWLTHLTNLCDRLAHFHLGGPTPDRAAARAQRRRAVDYGRKLLSLEPDNARFRYQAAWPLGSLAHLTEGNEARDLVREARAHNRYALERLTTIRDFHDYWSILAIRQMELARTDEERIACIRETLAVCAVVVRRDPSSALAVAYVGHALLRLTAHMPKGPGPVRDAWVAEAETHVPHMDDWLARHTAETKGHTEIQGLLTRVRGTLTAWR